MTNLLSLLMTAPVVLGAPVLAQSTAEFQGDQHWSAWPDNLNGPGVFGKGVAAQFTPDGVVDLLQLDGSQLVLLPNADELFAPVSVRAGVTDLDRWPAAGAAGLDAVAIVGAAGLERIWYDAALDAFASESIDASAWAGAGLVRAADLNEDGISDLIGVAADRQTILVQLADSTYSAFQAGTGFQATADVRDLVVLPWDQDSAAEVAVLTDLGVDVYDLGGALLASFAAATPGGAICAIGQVGKARQRIAWITEYAPPAMQYLMVLAPGGTSDVVDLGALDAFAVRPTDYDLDGDDDVLISHRYSYELLWIENERSPQDPNGATFRQAGERKVFSVESSGSAYQNQAWPVVADLDGDGDDDVAFASEEGSRLVVFRGEAVDQEALRPGVESADYAVDFQGHPGVLNLLLTAPASVPAGATHLELRVWGRADSAAPLDTEPLTVQTFSLPGNWPIATSVVLPETDADFADNYHLHMRLVELDGSAGLVAAYPSSVATFGLLAADRQALEGDQPTGVVIDVPIPGGPLEPEKSPYLTSVRRFKIPQPPGGTGIPKFE